MMGERGRGCLERLAKDTGESMMIQGLDQRDVGGL